MKKIWAPWRMQYILSADKQGGCILCDKPGEAVERDADNYLLFRGRYNFIILNAFPYTPAHLMIAPYRHIASPVETTVEESSEHVDLIQLCLRLLKNEVKPDGFNIGMNLGRVAGAGLEGHIHTHIVPRWNGDHNFMAVIADTRVISEGLAATYAKLEEGLRKMENSGSA
jgi:ATP adenylyltransferase